MRLGSLSIALGVLGLCAHVAAQQSTQIPVSNSAAGPAVQEASPSAPPPVLVAPPPVGPVPVPVPVPAVRAPEATACAPACRAGFVCVAAQCVSACNPLCDAGSVCTADAQCVSEPAPAPDARSSSGLRFFGGPLDERSPADPSAERHDGFMLRVALGFGGASATQTNQDDRASSDNDKATFYGGAGSLSVDVGGAAAENVLVHGRFATFGISEPRRMIDGAKYQSVADTYTAALLLAPAVTYYFMPINLYLTGAVGLSSLALRYRDTSGQFHERASAAGLGFTVDVGKEWWADPDWGIGVAGRFWYSRASDDAGVGHLDYEFVGAAVLLSATYQ